MPQLASSMFTPITGAGGYFAIEPGDLANGIKSVDTANGLGLTVACALHVEANSFILYCTTTLNYWLNAAAAAAGDAPMVASAGETLRFSNRDLLKQFCFEVVGTTAFRLQYTQGEGGVPPAFFKGGSGGINPPPPPGLSAIITENTLWVMKNGADAGPTAGTRNRMDLPFLTLGAAIAAALPGDSIEVLAGEYICEDLDPGGIAVRLWGATLVDDPGSGAPIINAISGTPISITGFGLIQTNNSAQCIVALAAPLRLDIDVLAAGGQGVACTAAFTINARIQAATVGLDATSTGTVNGNIEATIPVQASGPADVKVNGNLTTSGTNAVECTGGRVAVVGRVAGALDVSNGGMVGVTGDINATGSAILADGVGSRVLVYGDVVGETDAILATDTAIVTVYGNVTGDDDTVHSQTGANIIIYGDGEGNERVANADGGLIAWVGDITGDRFTANCINAGEITTTGMLSASSGLAGYCEQGIMYINGHVASSNAGVRTNHASADLRMVGTMDCAAVALTCTAGSLSFNGTAVSTNDFGASINEGTLRLQGRIDSFRSCVEIQDSTQVFTCILGSNLTLISADITSVYSLDGNPCNVKVFQSVSANVQTEPVNIVQLINTVDVDVLYQ